MTLSTDVAGLDFGAFLRPGDHIVWGQACGEPTTLIEALIAQAGRIGRLSAFAATSFSGILDAEAAHKLDLSSMGAIGALRTVAAAGRLGIIPCHVSQIGPMIEQGLIGCDVAFVQVSPPDAEGNHSFGLINDFVQAAVAKARVVIAEVNERVPFTLGDAVLPGARIDCAVHVARTPVEVAPAKIGATDLAIAETAAHYVQDGAVIQVGIGAVPDAILRLLKDRRDLGVHSGMIGDGLVDLVEAGVITNARKPIDAGVSITGALIGTSRLYQFAHRNPRIGMRRASYTHSEAVLSRLPRLVTVNSAIEVDLTGQVNAEQSAEQYLGGTGGQVDYVRAGSRSPGGRSIIALPATAKGGQVSRIAAALCGPVTTARSDVDVIVTEYGAAELKGQTLAERTRRLIAIAHPDFREELERSAQVIRRRGF
ncbi:MAG TPA: acetyl-CoA hydrolase/transferase C-terminal domain-containing protein [Steroidobacteraceae bacterium]|nr:acetyl-CoA hydrolase/transferase C-terminal domain-containing protein [Steroidobacteraceae bacterium]